MPKDGPDSRLARVRAILAADRNQAARKLTEQASEPDALRKSVDDAGAIGSSVWLTYLFVVFYLAIATAGVKHRDLLLENSVKMPFLGIDLPLFVYFCLAPIILIVAHLYTLLYIYILAFRLRRYVMEIDRRSASDPAVVDNMRGQLPSSLLVQFLAGPTPLRSGLIGQLTTSVFWITLVIAPVLVLLAFQIVFLPYHSTLVTWLHRVALGVDLGLLLRLWPAVLGMTRTGAPDRIRRYGTAAAACMVPIGISLTCATFPGEWLDSAVGHLKTIPPNALSASIGQDGWTSFHEILFNGPLSVETLRRKSFFSNTIVLPRFDVIGGGRDPGDHGSGVSLRGRDLRGAVLTAANLRNVELSFADLTDANLDFAELQNAEMRSTILHSASLDHARMQGARLMAAQLQGADLPNAYLQGASLFGAGLQGANFDFAKMQAASLDRARLAGTFLEGADLRLANLDAAQAYGATLIHSDLRGASMRWTELQGARIGGAKLNGATLAGALVWRADFHDLHDFGIDGRDLVWSPSRLDEERFHQRRWKMKLDPFDVEAFRLIETANADLPARARSRVVVSLRVLDPERPFALESQVTEWQHRVGDGSVDPAKRQTALAEVMVDVACSPDESSGTVVKSVAFAQSIKAAGSGAPAVVQSLLDNSCPAAAALTAVEQARLRSLAKMAAGAPPPGGEDHEPSDGH